MFHRVLRALLKMLVRIGKFFWRKISTSTARVFTHVLTLDRECMFGANAVGRKRGPRFLGDRRFTKANDTRKFSPLAVHAKVGFDDIVGLEEAKQAIMLRMILPFRHPREAKVFGIKQGGGLLLFGPPGNGKTMLARAVANELDAPFFHIRPRDIFSGEVGKAEHNVADLFAELGKYRRVVLFLDEVDGIASRRRGNGSTIARRVVSELLDAMDGVGKHAVGTSMFVLAATNQPDMVDEAFRRPGRFDTEVLVGAPNPKARRHLLEVELGRKPVSSDVDIAELVVATDGFSCALVKAVVDKAADRAFLRNLGKGHSIKPVSMADLLAVCDALGQKGRQITELSKDSWRKTPHLNIESKPEPRPGIERTCVVPFEPMDHRPEQRSIPK